MKISVIGAGGWGTALAILLHFNGHRVTLWEYKKNYARTLRRTRINNLYLPKVKIPAEIEITNSVSEACEGQHMIVIATPTQFLRGVLSKFDFRDLEDTIIVSVSKGIEKDTHLTVADIVFDQFPALPREKFGVLSGPSHAEEVSRKMPTAVVAGAENSDTAKEIQAAFMNSYFRVYTSSDLVGVELGGALKNIIAIGAGIVDGAGFGDNTKALIMTRGISEMARFGTQLGARAETFSGLSGMGDLIVTCMSKHSRNRYVGELLGSGKSIKEILKSMNMIAEGVETCRSVKEIADQKSIDMPITEAVYEVIFEGRDPDKATYELLTRDIKYDNY